jgi:hypothetical protein
MIQIDPQPQGTLILTKQRVTAWGQNRSSFVREHIPSIGELKWSIRSRRSGRWRSQARGFLIPKVVPKDGLTRVIVAVYHSITVKAMIPVSMTQWRIEKPKYNAERKRDRRVACEIIKAAT